MREESPEKEQVIPLFPLLEEKKDKGKNKEGSGASQPVFEEISRSGVARPPIIFTR